MITCHFINWDKCLSHQIWPAITKGWPDTDKPVHFFWGLAGNNVQKIKEVSDKGEEWWYVDTGYFSTPIKRYPEPMILDKNKTYFRIVRGKLHTIRGKVGTGKRLNELDLLKEENHVIDCGVGLGNILFDIYLQSKEIDKKFLFTGVDKQSVYINFILDNLSHLWKDSITLKNDDIMNLNYSPYSIIYSYSPFNNRVQLQLM